MELDRFLPTQEKNQPTIAALIAVAINAMQRLMEVANQVDKKQQCLATFFLWPSLVRKN